MQARTLPFHNGGVRKLSQQAQDGLAVAPTAPGVLTLVVLGDSYSDVGRCAVYAQAIAMQRCAWQLARMWPGFHMHTHVHFAAHHKTCSTARVTRRGSPFSMCKGCKCQAVSNERSVAVPDIMQVPDTSIRCLTPCPCTFQAIRKCQASAASHCTHQHGPISQHAQHNACCIILVCCMQALGCIKWHRPGPQMVLARSVQQWSCLGRVPTKYLSYLPTGSRPAAGHGV